MGASALKPTYKNIHYNTHLGKYILGIGLFSLYTVGAIFKKLF